MLCYGVEDTQQGQPSSAPAADADKPQNNRVEVGQIKAGGTDRRVIFAVIAVLVVLVVVYLFYHYNIAGVRLTIRHFLGLSTLVIAP